MWFQVIHLTQNRTCFGKLTSLLSPTILKHFKQILKQGCIILAQIGSKLPIYPEIYSGNIDYYFCVPIVFNFTTFEKKISESKSSDKVSWFWPKLGLTLSTKRELFGKVGQHCIGLSYPIMLRNFKKILRKQIIKLHDFCPNFPLPPKGIFLKNWLLLLISNYWTPLR